MKVKEIKKAGTTLVNNYGKDNFQKILYNIAYDTNACIEVTDENGVRLYTKEMLGGNCLIHSDFGARLFKWRNELSTSETGEIVHIGKAPETDSQQLVYGAMIGTVDNVKAYIFLNCLLDPVSSTTQIIKQQLFYITIIVFELAFIITMFISKRLSDPIVKITKDTKQFAKRNFNIKFQGGGYQETQDLAEVLNYAEKEISKVDVLRKELISNISHDLRTPLTIIKGYAEMIKDLSGDNKPKREEHIEVIIKESDRLSELVSGLLELSKYESDNKPLELSAFETSDFIDEIMARYMVYEEREGYHFEVVKDENVVVKADRHKMLQVMFNFINNAVNYTGEDKKVIVKQINNEKTVRFEITDTGDGITQENLPLIFDRYYREKKTEREVVGTGLGLSIVKEILKLHEFKFGVTSKVSQGSTFWFEINR